MTDFKKTGREFDLKKKKQGTGSESDLKKIKTQKVSLT